MESTKIDRKRPVTSEIRDFYESISTLLLPLALKKEDAYWKTETRSWCIPPDELSYHMLYRNQSIEIDFGIFDSKRFFVTLDIAKLNPDKTYSSFSIFNFCEIAKFPSFEPGDPPLQGKQYLFSYSNYLKDFFDHQVVKEIMTGKYWYSFNFDMRDWATIPGMVQEMQDQYLASRKVFEKSGK